MRRRERVYVALLSPALVVLAVVTLAPFAFLLLTSLTPLNLARPATWLDTSQGLEARSRLGAGSGWGSLSVSGPHR